LQKQNIATEFSVQGLIKRSFLLLMNLSVKLLAQIAVIFIYARKLSMQDYGDYQSVWLYINIVSVVGLFGLPSLILSSDSGSILSWIKKNKNTFWVSALLLNIIPFLYILICCSQFNPLIRLILIAMILAQNSGIILETLMIKQEQERIVLGINILFNLCYFAYHIAVLHTGYSLTLLVMGICVFFITKFLALLFFYSRLRVNASTTVKSAVGKQWFFLGINDTLGILFKWLDKWFVLLFISVTQFAVYFNGSYEIPVFALMLGAVSNIMLVELSKHGSDIAYTKFIFNKSSLLLASITFPAFAFLFFYHTDFFTLIFSKKYAEAIPIFLISIFIIPARITNFTGVLQTRHRSDLIVTGAVIDLVIAIILMFALYPFWGLNGIALAFVVSTYVQATYYLVKTSQLLNEKIISFFPAFKLAILMTVSLLVIGLVWLLLRQIHFRYNFIAGIGVTGILCGALLYYHAKEQKRV